MIELPPSLARHFATPDGRTDFRALLATPDHELVALAREMPEAEWGWLYLKVRRLRVGWVEGMLARAAGIDPEGVRARFLRVLEAAAPQPTAAGA